MNPFETLGLPPDADLTEAQVKTAWRRIATATHPDRADGGDIARYTAAASAYGQLRTAWGRSEARADLTGLAGSQPPPPPQPVTVPVPRPGTRLTAQARAALMLPARIRHGRPLRAALRALTAALAAITVVLLAPGEPAAPAAVTGIITWWALTMRADLAPVPGR